MDYDADLIKDEAILTEYECSICGQDMFESGACDHWPGRTYLRRWQGSIVLCTYLQAKDCVTNGNADTRVKYGIVGIYPKTSFPSPQTAVRY